MNFFTKALMAVGLLATCNAGADICNMDIPGDPKVAPRIMRTIVLSKDRAWTGDNDNPMDPLHEQAVSLGVLTQAQADDLDQAAIVDFNYKYGIDFDNTTDKGGPVVVDPVTGVRTYPNVATFTPTIQGTEKDFFLVLDSEEKNRGRDWYAVMAAVTIEFINNGTIPGGIYGGSNNHYFTGYRYLMGTINLRRNNARLDIPPNSESFSLVSPQLAHKTINSWGFPEYAYYFNIRDAADNPGLYLELTTVLHSPTHTLFESRPMLIFPCPQENILKKEDV